MPATVTVDSFLEKTRYQAFLDLEPELVDEYLQDAIADLPESVWGNRLDRAIELLLCHRLTMREQGINGLAAGGSISSLSVSQGSQSVSFSGGNSKDDPEGLSGTVCGREFLDLRRRTSFNTGFVIRGSGEIFH